ncbi:MAG: FAD-dependent thymidylate synthase [Tenericutes bacterium]|nr:FAD-dependent thymidylate synthase [Mycoplasmatota bacterium]
MKIDILPNYYLEKDGRFNKEKALNLCGKIAGVCYDKEGYKHLENEPIEKTNKRIDMTLNNGHHSVYDHINISLNLQNIPKILAMVLNNEHQYTTSEKSARYTPVVKEEGSIITELEENLYNKWLEIFKAKIKDQYGYIYNDSKIQKLAQENARYLVTVFMPTQMIYTTSFRQINYLASWMDKYTYKTNNNDFGKKLGKNMEDFYFELLRLNILESGLMFNEKDRNISLFGKELNKKEEIFSDIYQTTYKGSFAQLAQAQRHRTLDYKIELLDEKEYFVPPIIKDDEQLVEEWLNDMNKVKDFYPQGELVYINEIGKYDDFILKCKERLCSSAQLEIMQQTKATLVKYKDSLEKSNNPLKDNIKLYSKGARCTFPDYTCSNDCNFKEGKLLSRKI